MNLRKLKSCKHLLRPQRYEAKYQFQEKNSKKHKYMDIKQHVSKKPTDYRRNQKGNKKKFLETNEKT